MTLLLDDPHPAIAAIDNPPPEIPPSGPPSAGPSGPGSSNSGPRWGRRILIGTGALTLALGIAATAVAAPHFDDGVGDRTYHPTTFAQVDHHYSFGIGTLEVDLRDVDFPPGTHRVTVDHGIGSAQVWLPNDVNYDVTGDLDIGEVDLFGRTSDGFGNDLEASSATDDATTVIIDLEVDIGYGRVRQG